MKKIGFITKNRLFAQSLATQIKNNPDLGFEPYLMHDIDQALLDAEVFKIDMAVVEMIAGTPEDREVVLPLCESLKRAIPGCRILLFLAQSDDTSRAAAIKAMKRKIIDDFIFYDETLEYFVAKLLSLK
jgi:hypothetical protein